MITLTPGQPIPAALLNALQDCIWQYLHPEIESPIAPQSFIPTVGSTAVRDDGVVVGAMKLVDGNSTIYAPIAAIPTCDRITQLLVAWKATSANVVELDWTIFEHNLATGAQNSVVDIITVNAGATYQTFLQSGINFQCNPGCVYFLRCIPVAPGGGHVSPAGDIYITGATVKHDNL